MVGIKDLANSAFDIAPWALDASLTRLSDLVSAGDPAREGGRTRRHDQFDGSRARIGEERAFGVIEVSN